MARQNYGSEKRQRELARERKKAEKMQRKLERQNTRSAEDPPGDEPDAPTDGMVPLEP